MVTTLWLAEMVEHWEVLLAKSTSQCSKTWNKTFVQKPGINNYFEMWKRLSGFHKSNFLGVGRLKQNLTFCRNWVSLFTNCGWTKQTDGRFLKASKKWIVRKKNLQFWKPTFMEMKVLKNDYQSSFGSCWQVTCLCMSSVTQKFKYIYFIIVQ